MPILNVCRSCSHSMHLAPITGSTLRKRTNFLHAATLYSRRTSVSPTCHYLRHERGFRSSRTTREKPILDMSSGTGKSFHSSPSRGKWRVPVLAVYLAVSGTLLLTLISVARNAFSVWPPELRDDLRSAVRAKHAKDYETSAAYFHRAYRIAKNMPLEQLGPEPYLKLSGIAIALGEVAELKNSLELAFWAYHDVYEILHAVEARTSKQSDIMKSLAVFFGNSDQDTEDFPFILLGKGVVDAGSDLQGLSYHERLRLVALAFRLSEIVDPVYPSLHGKDLFLFRAALSTWLIIAEDEAHEKSHTAFSHQPTELPLPSWTRHANLMAPLEAYAKATSEAGNYGVALRVYMFMYNYYQKRLLSASPHPSCRHCEFAEMVNNFGNCILDSDVSTIDWKLAKAETLTSLGQETAMDALTKKFPDDDLSHCEQILPVILVNLGTLQEMRGALEIAQSSFSNALAGAKSLGQNETAEKAQEGLTRVTQLRLEEKSKEVEVDAAAKGEM